MSEQSSHDQRYSFPAAGPLPGEDDGQVAPDEAMVPRSDAAATPQDVDPGGYPHDPSPDVPRIPTDVGDVEEQDLPQPEEPAGPGRHNAQTDRERGA